jgi:hypothetical protein
MKVFLVFVLGLPCFAQSAAPARTCRNTAKIRCVDEGNRAGWPGTTVDSWLAAAALDLGGGGTIQIAQGAYTLGNQFHFASNTRYEFDPLAVISVSASYAGNVAMDMSGVTNVELTGGVFDGNRAKNSQTLDGLYVINSSKVTISKTVIRNFRGNGINLTSGDAFITVANSEIYNNGAPLPAAVGWGISISPASEALSHIQIGPGDNIHDNNGGMQVTNSTSRGAVEDVKVVASRFHHNANDGALFTAFHFDGGVIQGVHVENNEADCNGWPANGAGFAQSCLPAGFLQSGATDSSGGSGFDFIQNGDALLLDSEAIGNKAHDNAYDGFDATYNPSVRVNVSGSTVTWISGPKFNTAWKQNQPVLIHGAAYKIASCESAMRCTLTTSAGILWHASFQGASVMKLVFSANEAVNNGNSNIPPNVGAGFYSQFADGVTYRENEALDNNLEGFELFYCDFTAFRGDRAYSNNAGGTPGRNIGFSLVGGRDNLFEGISADDLTASPKQTIGVRVGRDAVNTVIRSSAIQGKMHPVEDLGTNTTLE